MSYLFLNVKCCKYELHVCKLTFQLIPVLSKVKDSMDGMVSFSPEDVIFLLNKWDSISHEDVEQQETYFEETKKYLHQTWKKVDDSCIFKFSAKKVSKYNVIGLKRKKDITNIVYHNISEIQFSLTIKFEK